MKLGPYELDQIYTGDARELAKAIPDESIDLIFTDPVYDRIDDYRWLAKTAERVLKSDSACLVWFGQNNLPHILNAMSISLSYAWLLILNRIGGGNWGRTGTKKYESLLWMEKGNSKPYRQRLWDHHQSAQWPKLHELHWDKPQETIEMWLDGFTQESQIVFDPFTGSGTVPAVCKMLGRHYLAFEIDPDTAERARQRVANTQPPLFVPQPEQLELEAMA